MSKTTMKTAERWVRGKNPVRVVKQAPDGSTADQVNAMVERQLKDRQPIKFKGVLIPEATGRYGGQWIVVIRPDRDGVSSLDMGTLHRRVERDVRRYEGRDDLWILSLIPPEFDESEPELPE